MGPNEIRLVSLAVERGLLKENFTVIELGDQTLKPSAVVAGRFAHKAFGWYGGEPINHASELYSRLGCPRYESITMTGGVNAHLFDPENDLSTVYSFNTCFDLVTNFGVSAQLFDQRTIFANIHALTVVGGIMLHALPINRQDSNLFNAAGALFQALSAANGYRIEGLFFAVDGDLYPWSLAPPVDEGTGCALCAVLVKLEAHPFVIPSLKSSEIDATQPQAATSPKPTTAAISSTTNPTASQIEEAPLTPTTLTALP
jgi:hypothetical protein